MKNCRKQIVSIMCAFVLAVCVLPTSAFAANSTPWLNCSSWASSYMEQAYRLELLPDDLEWRDLTVSITRAEFVEVALELYELLSGRDVPEYHGQNPFTDTRDDDILDAYALGIIEGTGSGTFSPNGTLTREQAATMLGRVAEIVKYGSVGDGEQLADSILSDVMDFADDTDIDSWAKNYVTYLVAIGAVNGTGNNRFSPDATMTREAAIKIAVEMV